MSCVEETVELGEAVASVKLPDELSSLEAVVLPIANKNLPVSTESSKWVCDLHKIVINGAEEDHPHSVLPNGLHACERCIEDDIKLFPRELQDRYWNDLRENMPQCEFDRVNAFFKDKYRRPFALREYLIQEIVSCARYSERSIAGVMREICSKRNFDLIVNYETQKTVRRNK